MTGRRPWVLLLAAFVLCAGTARAQAAGYRYWSFWDRDGDRWTYATQGPATARPSDGDVQGFRFAVSENTGDAARPRGEADFATICASTPKKDGEKRVALVIDFGTQQDAPPTETPPPARTACASVSPDATASDALAAVAKPLRYDTNALLCAIGGYPRTGCGEQVANKEKAEEKEKDEKQEPVPDNGPSLGLLGGGAAVAALAAAAVWQARRRRHV